MIAMLVFVAAISAPSITNTFASQSLIKSADLVRAGMGQARVRAIRTGEVHALIYAPGGTWFDVAPLSDFSQQLARANRRVQDQANGLTTNFEDDLLPNTCRFVGGQTALDSRSAFEMESVSDVGNVTPILFYPDGTSQDATLTLQNVGGQLVEVQLRGLTGIASIVRNPDSSGGGRRGRQ